MRLTKKETNILSSNGYHKCDYLLNGTPKYKALNKLGQLEDKEEEIGIDLSVLFEALQNGIYVYSSLDKCVCHTHVRLNFNGTLWLLVSDDFAIFPKKLTNYGKTWALTKEELKGK